MRRFTALFGAALMVAVACGAPTPPSSGGSPVASEQPVPGGRIVEGSTGDPQTMQPVISTDTTSSGAWSWLYFGLTRVDRDTGETEGNLAGDAPKLPADGRSGPCTQRGNLPR